jgi:hypothetical protein
MVRRQTKKPSELSRLTSPSTTFSALWTLLEARQGKSQAQAIPLSTMKQLGYGAQLATGPRICMGRVFCFLRGAELKVAADHIAAMADVVCLMRHKMGYLSYPLRRQW